jgi:hypothetical protein
LLAPVKSKIANKFFIWWAKHHPLILAFALQLSDWILLYFLKTVSSVTKIDKEKVSNVLTLVQKIDCKIRNKSFETIFVFLNKLLSDGIGNKNLVLNTFQIAAKSDNKK